MTERVSIQAQLDHHTWMANTLDHLEPEAKKRGLATEREAPMRVRYTGAIRTTLQWLRDHETTVRALAGREGRLQRIERALVSCFEQAAIGVLTVEREGADWRLQVEGREVDVSLTEIAEANDDMLMGRRPGDGTTGEPT